MLTQAVVIVIAADEARVAALSAALAALNAHADPARAYEVAVLHPDLTEASRGALLAMPREGNVSLRFVEEEALSAGSACLRAPFLMEAYEKFVCLDAETLLLHDPAELFDTDVSGCLLAACPDYEAVSDYFDPAKEQKPYWDAVLQLPDPEKYISPAVMVVNAEAFRTLDLTALLALSRACNWQRQEQDVLNHALQGRVTLLPAAWDPLRPAGNLPHLPENLAARLQDDAPCCVLSFSGKQKPWLPPFPEQLELFWHYAAQTPFAAQLVERLGKYLSKKHDVLRRYFGERIELVPVKEDVQLRLAGTESVLGCQSELPLTLEELVLRKGALYIRGRAVIAGPEARDKVRILLRAGGKELPCSMTVGDPSEYRGKVLKTYAVGFEYTLPLTEAAAGEMSFLVELNGCACMPRKLRYGDFCPVSQTFKHQYYAACGWCIMPGRQKLTLRKVSLKDRYHLECNFLEELASTGRPEDAKDRSIRIRHWRRSLLPGRQVWLVSDRINKGDDNGEAFFRYLRKRRPVDVKSFFVLEKDCPDFERMGKIGPVVDAGSDRHLELLLRSRFNISSHADAPTVRPFAGHEALRDLLCGHRFVFLQHGITKDDISMSINRQKQNMKLFVAAARQEEASLLDTPTYQLNRDLVKLTGFPRYDRLYNDPKRYITIMPTWRKSLFNTHGEGENRNTPVEGFTDSAYYAFYNGLLNHPRLLAAAKEHGYQLRFMPHPLVHCALPLFTKNEAVHFYPYDEKYRTVFAESDLVVTDHSSAVFDFAYLRKPVVYAHFDNEMLQPGQHIYTPGFFDYETMGFGEVVHDLETLVEVIIGYIKADCALKDEYRQRIDAFFAFNDKENCRRVYEAVRQIP